MITNKNICFYCGIDLSDKTRTIDHIKAKSKGGKNINDNKVFCCKYCNNDKGNKSLKTWLEKLQQTPIYHRIRIYNIKKLIYEFNME